MSEGVRIEYRDVTPGCRGNRGADQAYDDAAHELWHAYATMVARHPGDTVRLSLERVAGHRQDDGRETT